MSLISELRDAIKNGKCPPIFKPADLDKIGIKDSGRNISNYDKKNGGTSHENVLVSRKIGEETYYTFDEQMFSILPPKNAIKSTKAVDGTIY